MPSAIDQATAAYYAAAGVAPPETPAKSSGGVGHDVLSFLDNIKDLSKVLTVGEGSQKTVLGDSGMDVPKTVKDLVKAVNPALDTKTETPKKKATKAGTPATTSETPSEAELKAQIAQGDLWNQLGQQLVAAQSNLDKPVEESISGALTAPAESSAATQALSSMGLAPNSSASSWLNDQIKQANSNDAPLTAAMNTYTKEYESGQSGVSAALSGMGQANALSIDTAPEADWIQTLAQHIMSNVNYYGQVPTSAVANMPPALQYYLSQSGAGGTSTSGEESLQNLAAGLSKNLEPPTGKATTTLPSINGAAPSATSGTIPGDVSNAQAG